MHTSQGDRDVAPEKLCPDDSEDAERTCRDCDGEGEFWSDRREVSVVCERCDGTGRELVDVSVPRGVFYGPRASKAVAA